MAGVGKDGNRQSCDCVSAEIVVKPQCRLVIYMMISWCLEHNQLHKII